MQAAQARREIENKKHFERQKELESLKRKEQEIKRKNDLQARWLKDRSQRTKGA